MLLEDLVEKNLLGTVPKVSFVRTYSGLLPCEHPIPCIQLQPLNLQLGYTINATAWLIGGSLGASGLQSPKGVARLLDLVAAAL